MRKSRLFLLIWSIFLAACSPGSTEQPQIMNSVSTQTPMKTYTPTYAPAAGLVDGKISTVGYMDEGILIIVIESQEKLSGDFRAVVGDEEFSCTLQDMVPEKLYCSGPQPEGQTSFSIKVYPAGVNDLLFEGQAELPDL